MQWKKPYRKRKLYKRKPKTTDRYMLHGDMGHAPKSELSGINIQPQNSIIGSILAMLLHGKRGR